VADVQRAQLCVLPGRRKSRRSSAASSSQRSPASPSTSTIAEIARARQRVVRDPRLRFSHQPLVLAGAQRLRRCARDQCGREALDQVGGRRDELAAHARVRRRRRIVVADDELELVGCVGSLK
jgi:hypothetical protein